MTSAPRAAAATSSSLLLNRSRGHLTSRLDESLVGIPEAHGRTELAGWAQTGKSDFYEPADSRLRGKAARGGQGV